MNKVERMKELIATLNQASVLYYQYSTIMMTDYEYDKLYDELVELEKETGITLSNSPTINVEPEVSSSLKKVEHPSPMLSLAKTKNIDELEEFLGKQNGLLSWKLDGLTIVLTYDKGELISGVTRGNGIIGEDVYENVRQFKNIPLRIAYKERLVLRGEAIIKYSDFERMNNELGDSVNQYKNPRNLCSGSVRQLDSKITAKRCVNLIVFALISASDKNFSTKSEEFAWLSSLGFTVVENFPVTKDTVRERVLDFKNRVVSYDIPSDGLVLTYDSIEYSNSLGTTAKYPKHSMAFKWQDETAETVIRDIDWMVSRTGLINPVAVFDPVELEGTVVSRASLHNVSVLKGLKIGIGDTVLVYKANMIIPQIADNLTKSNNLLIPDKCPRCNHQAKIISENDIEYLYCMNEVCPAKLIKRLSLFVSRNAMNIDGLSDQILSKLIEMGIVNSPASIYRISKYKDTIMSSFGFGVKSYNNLIDSIEASRNVRIANFIYSLGIPEIGLSRAKLICKNFNNSIDKIRNLEFDVLSQIYGIGPIIAREWIDAFNNEDFLQEFNEILKEVNIISEDDNSQILDKLNFVITGSLSKFDNRDMLVEYIEKNGGKVLKAVSSNVDYLINNDVTSNSSKNKKAKELGIKIISEDEFLELCKGDTE